MMLTRVRRGAAFFVGGGSSAKRLAIGSAFWVLLSIGGSQVLRFGTNLLSTRLLFPELFGLMALVTTIHLGIALFSDVGIGVSIVRHKRGEERQFLNTAWTTQILRGLLIFCVALMAAPLAADFYDEPRLRWLVPLFGFNAIIYGFSSTSVHLMRRRVQARRTALLELSSQGVGLAVLLIWAWLSPGILALAAGPFATSCAMLIGSHLMNRPHRDGIGWDREAASELLGFGKWVFVSTAFTFLAGQADRLLLGKLYSLTFLGVYNIAFGLAEIPRSLILTMASRVIFPMLARAADMPRGELLAKVARPRFNILLALAVGLGVAVACGDVLIIFLYDDRYVEAAWMMPVLAASVWISVLSRTVDSMLLVAGKPKVQAFAFAGSFVFLLGGVLLGDHLLGELGAIIAIALSPLAHYAIIAAGLRSEKFWLWRQDLVATFVFLAVAVTIFWLRTLAGPYPYILAEIGLVNA